MWPYLLVLILVPSLAQADLFDRARQALRTDVSRADMSGVSLRGGAALTTGQTGSASLANGVFTVQVKERT